MKKPQLTRGKIIINYSSNLLQNKFKWSASNFSFDARVIQEQWQLLKNSEQSVQYCCKAAEAAAYHAEKKSVKLTYRG